MAGKTRTTYPTGADEAALAIALSCFLLSLGPPLVAFLVPMTNLEVSRIDGLHRISGIASACFSSCVLMAGYGHNQRRSVICCCIAGSTLLTIACITGTGCCSELIAWMRGQISASQISEGALVTAGLSPSGSVCLMLGHQQNLRWARSTSKKSASRQRT